MLIYLDAMIVQYIADYNDYIFQDILSGKEIPNPIGEPKLATELVALRRIIFLEQFGHWDIVAPAHLVRELKRGKPTQSQLEIYGILLQAWNDSLNWWNEGIEPNEKKISSIENLLASIKFQHKADRRHLAEAVAIQASWFLTNDKNIIKLTREKKHELKSITDEIKLLDPIHNINQMLKRLLNLTTVARPSESVEILEKGLSLR
jgi:hypothetical protein